MGVLKKKERSGGEREMGVPKYAEEGARELGEVSGS